MLFYPSLPKAAGSAYVEKRLRALGAKAHVFGHTHFLWDMELEGVRYVQWALGSPQEQKRRNPFGETNDLFLLYGTLPPLPTTRVCRDTDAGRSDRHGIGECRHAMPPMRAPLAFNDAAVLSGFYLLAAVRAFHMFAHLMGIDCGWEQIQRRAASRLGKHTTGPSGTGVTAGTRRALRWHRTLRTSTALKRPRYLCRKPSPTDPVRRLASVLLRLYIYVYCTSG